MPNAELRKLLAESGWTGQMLAGAVNGLGAENGVTLRYDRTSISHWLSGSRPSPQVVDLVAEVFSRQLGRPVGPEDTGLVSPAGRALRIPLPREPVEQLVWMGTASTSGQDVLRGVTYSLTRRGALPLVGTSPPAGGRGRIGVSHAAAATSMVSVFSAIDMAFGGGTGRVALSAYLATTVAPWLRASATPKVRARLNSAAARLCYLAGWMCFDDMLQGAGQRYYQAAARLAADAGDACCYAAALRSLSVQAHYLGHRRMAFLLAEAAMRQSHRVPPMEAAFLTGQLGVAAAAYGDSHAALGHLSRAERLLHRTEGSDAHVGGYDVAALAHQQAEILDAIGDRPAALRALTVSLRHRKPDQRRALAITSARLAELHLSAGHLDRACTAWSVLLDERPNLTSGRVDRAVRSMCAHLRPHSNHHAAKALLKRASAG
ncbi:hypothetical protein ABZ816_00105 [Actinosynnema sp. NPDC047251]|uniref:hypothetical protein n=1 Tax=Saccharothrix espanaensis TaxID=103731 RepID=UPI001E32A48F|nr:hypothetical protein [Saccharothrix espanaensis]